MIATQNPQDAAHQMIGCGMYAISSSLETAWCNLLGGFEINNLEGNFSPTLGNINIEFSTADEIYTAKNCLFAQTCGLPYLKKWQKSHGVICVPKFDIDGCQGLSYRSWFIKKKTNGRNKLEDFQNTRAAINSWESNSGMNALRFAVSNLDIRKPFFSEVQLTGAHHQSALSVAKGTADIAAIDAVTFYFLSAVYPEIIEKIEVFDQSVLTPGLPFIHNRNSAFTAEEITLALNLALNKYQQSTANPLKITSFQQVDESSYLEIQRLEQRSVKNGYPVLA